MQGRDLVWVACLEGAQGIRPHGRHPPGGSAHHDEGLFRGMRRCQNLIVPPHAQTTMHMQSSSRHSSTIAETPPKFLHSPFNPPACTTEDFTVQQQLPATLVL